jgi:hypothetical protein
MLNNYRCLNRGGTYLPAGNTTNVIQKNKLMRKINFTMFATVIALCSACSKKDVTGNGSAGSLKVPGINGTAFSSAPGDVVGKLTVGYQGWFLAANDGSSFNSWQHSNYECWPDVREYSALYGNVQFDQGGVLQPAFTGNLGNGQPAKSFSTWDQSTVDTHFLWMQQNGIDCAALQRFPGGFGDPRVVSQVNSAAGHVKAAAQTYGRKFYIMYDCSATDPVQTDWTNTIVGTLALTASSSYAKQNGKPVVCLWGVGKPGRGAVTDWVNTINWFKSQGCYVIGGPLGGFSTDTANQPAYNACNMIMAWEVGRTASTNFQTLYAADLAYCNAHGIDYQANVFPGFSFNNSNTAKPKNEIPRTHGNFMWQQFTGAKNAGVSSVYVSMFDEINEATGIMKCAEDVSMIPAGKSFVTMDADGVHVSSDFYLRLTNDGANMIKGTLPYTAVVPTPFVYLDRAEATTGWAGANPITVNTGDRKEGTASLQSVGSGTDEFKKTFSAFNSGATAAAGAIDFWYYVSDVTQFSASNQIELGSGGGPDVNEYNWNIGTLVNGWNHIHKTFATAGMTGGTPNLSAINWFRIYHAKTASITTKVDAILIKP